MNINEIENNNLRENANEVNIDDTITGCISANNDVDCYKIIFPKKAWVTFELDVPAGTDYRIRVYKNGNYDTDVETEDTRLGSYGTMRSCSAYVDDTTITYYICISANTSNAVASASNYTLRIFYSTNDSVKEILEEYRTTINNKYWNKGINHNTLSKSNFGITNKACTEECTSNEYYSSWQCCGFALFLAKVVFGDVVKHSELVAATNGDILHRSSGDWIVYKGSVSNVKLKAGDIIRRGGHSAMILDATDMSNVKVVECWGSVGCKIAYGNFNGTSNNANESTFFNGNIEYLAIAPII